MIQLEFIGYVGADAELRQTQQGKSFVSFRAAASKRWKDDTGKQMERTTWIKCSRTGTQNFASCLRKGQRVYGRGDVDAKVYTNNKGESVPELICHAWDIEFLSNKDKDAPF